MPLLQLNPVAHSTSVPRDQAVCPRAIQCGCSAGVCTGACAIAFAWACDGVRVCARLHVHDYNGANSTGPMNGLSAVVCLDEVGALLAVGWRGLSAGAARRRSVLLRRARHDLVRLVELKERRVLEVDALPRVGDRNERGLTIIHLATCARAHADGSPLPCSRLGIEGWRASLRNSASEC